MPDSPASHRPNRAPTGNPTLDALLDDLRDADVALGQSVAERRTVHTGRYLSVERDVVIMSNGGRSERDIIVHPGAVVVAPLDAEGRLLLVTQYRLAVGGALLELPAGTLDTHAGKLEDPLAAAHREIAPAEGSLTLSYATNAPQLPGESPRDALTRRLAETADKEAWNGTTLVGPHRDDLIFGIDDRDLTTFASRGQQRTAILALKLAELDLLTILDRRPPLLLLDDVFSELDPLRRGHLVRRIAELPQALITATAPDDLDPDLRRRAHAWRVVAGVEGTRVEEGEA